MATEAVNPSRLDAVWSRRRILQLLITRDLKVKYAGSVLGYFWSVLEPLMLAGIYWVVFTKLMRRQVGEEPYIVFLLAAMLPWQWANASLRASMRALSKDAKLVRSTSLPREIWVLRTVGSRMMEFLFSLPVLAAFAIATGAHLTWYAIFFPLAMVLQMLLLLGLGLLLAPVAVLYSDVERLITVLLRLLFYFSPILYGVHDISNRLGSTIAKLYILNPFAGILDLYRTAFFAEEWAGWGAVAVSAAISLLLLAIGVRVFRRLEGAVLKEI
ncbi:MAG: type transport system permease protein [Actinomycetota bacterium]|nr:type transport system permease protein [Actinomycetota bacterium]